MICRRIGYRPLLLAVVLVFTSCSVWTNPSQPLVSPLSIAMESPLSVTEVARFVPSVLGIITRADFTVIDIEVDSAAASLPIKIGDRLSTIGDTELTNADSVAAAKVEIASKIQGQSIRLRVLRAGERLTMAIVPKPKVTAFGQPTPTPVAAAAFYF